MRQFLTATDSGYWRISTRHTTYYILDLDNSKFIRVPGPGRGRTIYDNQWMIYDDFKCELGTPMTIVVDYTTGEHVLTTDVSEIKQLKKDYMEVWSAGFSAANYKEHHESV